MPVTLSTPTTVTVNAVLFPSIQITTRIDSTGKLKTGCQIIAQGAQLSNAGQTSEAWQAVGDRKVVSIADVDALPTDMASLATPLAAAQTAILAVLAALAAAQTLV